MTGRPGNAHPASAPGEPQARGDSGQPHQHPGAKIQGPEGQHRGRVGLAESLRGPPPEPEGGNATLVASDGLAKAKGREQNSHAPLVYKCTQAVKMYVPRCCDTVTLSHHPLGRQLLHRLRRGRRRDGGERKETVRLAGLGPVCSTLLPQGKDPVTSIKRSRMAGSAQPHRHLQMSRPQTEPLRCSRCGGDPCACGRLTDLGRLVALA